MRKIESSIVKAINDFRYQPRDIRSDEWYYKPSGQDTVETYTVGTKDIRDIYTVVYRLHGHAIFSLTINDEAGGTFAYLYSCGFRTATTKSRLNAILSSVLPGYRIHQKAHAWYISDSNGVSVPFFNGIRYAI